MTQRCRSRRNILLSRNWNGRGEPIRPLPSGWTSCWQHYFHYRLIRISGNIPCLEYLSRLGFKPEDRWVFERTLKRKGIQNPEFKRKGRAAYFSGAGSFFLTETVHRDRPLFALHSARDMYICTARRETAAKEGRKRKMADLSKRTDPGRNKGLTPIKTSCPTREERSRSKWEVGLEPQLYFKAGIKFDGRKIRT